MADCCGSMDPFGGASAEPDKPIAVRSNFNPLATFEPSAVTDASGSATVKFTLPDNLTRYRYAGECRQQVWGYAGANSCGVAPPCKSTACGQLPFMKCSTLALRTAPSRRSIR